MSAKDTLINIVISAKDHTSAGLGRVSSGLTKVKVAALAVVAAVAGVVSKFSVWVDAAIRQETAETKLEHTLKNVTGATREQVEALKDQARALQSVTLYGDETTMAAQAMLGTFALNADQIAQLTPGLLDMAAALDQAGQGQADLTSQATALGKAFTDGIGSLKRYGVTITEAQEKQWAMASQSERVAMMTEVLSQNFGGLAEAVGAKFSGAMAQAKNAAGDTREELGKLVTQSSAWERFVRQITGWWQEIGKGVGESQGNFELLSEVIVRTLTVAGNTVKFFWNTLQIGAKTATMAVMEGVALILSGIAKITFGDVSARFAEEAANIRGAAAEIRQSIVKDAEEAQDALLGIVDAAVGTSFATKDAEDKVRKLGAAAAALAKEAGHTSDASARLALSLKETATAGGDTAKQIDGIVSSLDVANAKSLTDITGAIQILRGELAETATLLEERLNASIEKMSTADLSSLSQTIAQVREEGGHTAEQLVEIDRLADTVLSASFAKLGIDGELALTGISKASREAIENLDLLEQSLALAGITGAEAGRIVGEALLAAIPKADSTVALKQHIERLQRLGLEGKLSGEQAAEGMKLARQRMDDLLPGINSVEEAFRKLGITSEDALKKAATEAREAYEVIRDGDTTINEQKGAWLAWAAAAVKANGGVADSALKAEAAALGLSEELGRLVGRQKEVGDAARSSSGEFDRLSRAIESNTGPSERLGEAIKKAFEDGLISGGEYAQLLDMLKAKTEGLGDASRRISKGGEYDWGSMSDADLKRRLDQTRGGGDFGTRQINAILRAEIEKEMQRRREAERDTSSRPTTKPPQESQRLVRIDLAFGGRAATVYAEDERDLLSLLERAKSVAQ